MNYEELHRYIRDLQQSGFDVWCASRVQHFYKKLSVSTDHADYGRARISLRIFCR